MNKIQNVVDHYLEISGREDYVRHCRAAKQLLELTNNDVDLACQKLDKTFAWFDKFGEKEDFRIETTIKKFIEL